MISLLVNLLYPHRIYLCHLRRIHSHLKFFKCYQTHEILHILTIVNYPVISLAGLNYVWIRLFIHIVVNVVRITIFMLTIIELIKQHTFNRTAELKMKCAIFTSESRLFPAALSSLNFSKAASLPLLSLFCLLDRLRPCDSKTKLNKYLIFKSYYMFMLLFS